MNYQDGVPGTLLDEGNQVDNVRHVYNESENKWTPDYPVYYYDKVTPVDIVGYYPYTTNISVNAYSFEVAKDQSTDAICSCKDFPTPANTPFLSMKIGYVWFGRWILSNVLKVSPSNGVRLFPPQKSRALAWKSFGTTNTKYSCT